MVRPGKVTWHEKVVDAAGLRCADRLASVAGDFYLAGGTGLALRLGHRISLDLDLFSDRNPLGTADRRALIEALEASGPVDIRESSDGALHLILAGTRVSFLRYRYPLAAKPASWRGVAVAAPEDVAAMKVSAIMGRGSKKDFIDLHAAARLTSLERLLQGAVKKYSDHPDFLLQAARALVYFDDADKEPSPRLLSGVNWDEVKAYFERQVPALVRSLLRA